MIYRELLVYDAEAKAWRCHPGFSLPGSWLFCTSRRDHYPVRGSSSQRRNASPRENHTLVLVLLAHGAAGSNTGLTGSCRWSSSIRTDGKNKAWRGNPGQTLGHTTALYCGHNYTFYHSSCYALTYLIENAKYAFEEVDLFRIKWNVVMNSTHQGHAVILSGGWLDAVWYLIHRSVVT